MPSHAQVIFSSPCRDEPATPSLYFDSSITILVLIFSLHTLLLRSLNSYILTLVQQFYPRVRPTTSFSSSSFIAKKKCSSSKLSIGSAFSEPLFSHNPRRVLLLMLQSYQLQLRLPLRPDLCSLLRNKSFSTSG